MGTSRPVEDNRMLDNVTGRDLFAMVALTKDHSFAQPPEMAIRAYQMADAMMVAWSLCRRCWTNKRSRGDRCEDCCQD